MLRTEDEEVEKAREQLYKDIGYVENDEWKYPKEVRMKALALRQSRLYTHTTRLPLQLLIVLPLNST